MSASRTFSQQHLDDCFDQYVRRCVITPSGCLLWTGQIARQGYGVVRLNKRAHLIHRIAYMAATGQWLTPEVTLDHLCHTESDCEGGNDCLHRRCINPDHLDPCSQPENASRQWRSRKPTCKQGHPYDEENTYWRKKSGRRDCRTCIRDRVARYKERLARAA